MKMDNKSKVICTLLAITLLMVGCGEGTKNTDVHTTSGEVKQVEEEEQVVEGEKVDQAEEHVDEAKEYHTSEATPIASIPEQDIYIYEIEDEGEGLLLQIGELEQKVSWNYLTPRGILPRLQVDDFDLDGKEELAVMLNIGSGSGVSVDELHMIEWLDDSGTTAQSITDHLFSEEEYNKQIDEFIQFNKVVKDEELYAQLTIDNQRYEINIAEYDREYGSDKIYEELGFGNIVYFEFQEEQLVLTAAIGLIIEGVAEPQYIGEFTAPIYYQSGTFTLVKPQFKAT